MSACTTGQWADAAVTVTLCVIGVIFAWHFIKMIFED
jgi:hypothetical protein